MTFDEFRATLRQTHAPQGLTPALRALWEDARGDWEAAHATAQGIEDSTGAWIHAYLHRKGGDLQNAGYWYRRAGQSVAEDGVDEEWVRIVSSLL